MKVNRYIINAGVGLLAILIYFTYSYLQLGFLDVLHIDYQAMSLSTKVLYLIVTGTLEIVFLFFLFRKKLKEDVQDLKKNHEGYFKTYFKYWLFALAIMMISNLIIMLITENQTSKNEEAVRSLLTKSPIYAYFSSVIFAPFVEEIIFRRSIRNVIPIDSLFIIVSGLVFGGLHIITGFSGPLDLLYLIPYCTPGLIFAYILTKTDNVLVTAGIHLMHNGIMVSLQIFIYLFLGTM